MPDDTPPSPPAPPPPSPPPSPPPQPRLHLDDDRPPRRMSESEYERQAHELRAEAAARRVEAQNAKEEAERARRAAETARQEADQRVAEAERAGGEEAQRWRRRAIDYELRDVARAEGLQDLDLLHLPVVDRTKITVDVDGNVTGAKEVVAAFKAAKPDYFRPATSPPPADTRRPLSTGPANPPPPPVNGPPPAQSVRGMSRAEYRQARTAARNSLRA